MAYPNDALLARVCPEILPRTIAAGNTGPGSAAVGLAIHASLERDASWMHEGAGDPGNEAAHGHSGEAAHDGGVGPGFRLAR